jgi:hypothetical protein
MTFLRIGNWPFTAAEPLAVKLVTTGGAFYDAASSVGLTDAQLRATAVPVSGTFWPATQPVSGSVAVSNFPVSQPVTGTFWQATQPVSGTFWQATQPVSGTFWQATQPVSLPTSGVALNSSVAGTTASATLFNANASRKIATICNDSAATLYVLLGAGASTSAFTVKLAQDDYYEVPACYTGPISGTWSAASGNARLTEVQ